MFEAHGSNKSNFCFLVATSARTKDETIDAQLKSQNNFESQNNFVRAYRDRTGSNAANSGMRMSMAIRPQTVSSLASKFDSIIHDKSHTSKSNSRQLKLRTYDISKIITELNKLNTDLDTPEHAKSDKNTHKYTEKKATSNLQSKWCDEKEIKSTQECNKLGKSTVIVTSETFDNLCGKIPTEKDELATEGKVMLVYHHSFLSCDWSFASKFLLPLVDTEIPLRLTCMMQEHL